MADKQAMGRSVDIFRVQQGSYGTVEEADCLMPNRQDPYLVRVAYDGNPKGSYGVWLWARCVGVSESAQENRV